MVGNGNVMIAEKKWKLRCEIIQKNGESLTIMLENVKSEPYLRVNLFSIIKALKNEIIIGNEGEMINFMKS
jgi:hypothetical protein